MKKSTLAIAALITTLSTAIIVPAAYADDSTTPAPAASPATPDATAPDATAPASDATAPDAATPDAAAPAADDGSAS